MIKNKINHQEQSTFPHNLSYGGLIFYFFAASVLWHYMLYGVTFWFDFAKDDDYFFFSYDHAFGFQNHPQWGWWYQLGRYGSAEIWQHLSFLITNLEDLLKIRGMSLFMSSFSMTLLALSFFCIKVNKLFALFVAALIFSLPAIALNFTYILGFPSTVAWIFSLLAFLTSFTLFGGQLAPSKLGFRETLGALLAIGFLFVSISIYQMSMFFFLVPCTFYILFGDRIQLLHGKSVAKKIWCMAFPMVVTFTVAGSYYFFHKLVYLPRFLSLGVGVSNDGANSDVNDSYKFTTSPDYLENAYYFFQSTVPKIFDVISLKGYPSLWFFIAGLILLSLLVSWCNYFLSDGSARPRKDPSIAIFSALAVCGYFFLSSAPIVAQGTHSTYRVILVMSAIVFLVFIWAGLRLLNLLKGKFTSLKIFLSYGLLATVLVSTHTMVVSTTRAEASDLDYVSKKVRQFLETGQPLHRVHFVKASEIEPATGDKCDIEFFCTSSRIGTHFVWAIKAAIEKEIGYQKDIVWGGWAYVDERRTGLAGGIPYRNYSSPIVLTHSSTNEVLPVEEGILIVDFSRGLREGDDTVAVREASVLESRPNKELIETVTFIDGQPYTEQREQHNLTRRNAFDGGLSGERFWETGGFPFPVDLTLDFVKPKSISYYSFYSRGAEERMPKVWKLEAFIPGSDTAIQTNDINVNKDWSNKIPILLGSREVNTVAFEGKTYSIPFESVIDLNRLKQEGGLLDSEDVFVKGLPSAVSGTTDTEAVPVSSEDFQILDRRLVNIIEFAGRVYSVPQSVGTVSLEQWRLDEVKSLDGVFVKILPSQERYGKWIEIDRQSLNNPWKLNETKTFSVEMSGEYETFRWTFTEGFNPGVMRLYEITVNETRH